MYDEKLVLGIYAVSPVHAGSGSEVSVIDLPIQRERHTGFPIVWGQSLKGVLRHGFKKSGKDEKVIRSIFGPDNKNADDHAAAIVVGDAKVLLFPVRSVKGVFAYVTCPIALERFKRDMELAGKSVEFSLDELKPAENRAIVNTMNEIVLDGKVVFEEVTLNADLKNLDSLVKALEPLLPDGIDVKKRIAIVPDDVFSAFVRFSTEVVARVAIDSGKGTVKRGGLWYEEFLPSETLLYSVIAIGKPKGGSLKSAGEVSGELKTFIEETGHLQIGGDETVGKGFVVARVF